jgi:uncharacterized protein (TIGR03085 family)
MGIATDERRALCDLLEELGPASPTLCEGWDTYDLAAHLVTRDRRPDAGPGLVIGALHSYTAMLEHRRRAGTPYERLIEQIRAGAPIYSPLRLEALNVHEYFVHHEDVRRANGRGPRPADPELNRSLWKALGRMGPMMTRGIGKIGLDLTTPTGESMRLRSGAPSVRLRGEVPELFLYLFGRKDAAEVEIDGPADAVAQLAAARIGP